jgi:cobalt-zinc-cadmium efflux system protein
MTFGLKRAEILSAAANGVVLAAAAVLVAVTAIERLIHPIAVDGATMVTVAAAGIGVNLAAVILVAGADRSKLNIAGSFAHLTTDLWAFVGSAAAGVAIMASGFRRADPIASLLVVALMASAAWGLLRASGRVLLEGAPEHVDLDSVRAHLLELPDVTAVHDLHAWVVTSDLPALSAHVVVSDDCFEAGRAPKLLDALQACLSGHFDVEHSTFQLEPVGHSDHETEPHD